MKVVVAAAYILFLASPIFAQDEQIVLPVLEATGVISAGYFDASYLDEEGVQHLGVDIPAPVGSPVLSPVSGTVILNRTNVSDPYNAYLVIRSASTGFEHVLAHISSDMEVPTTVEAGDKIGKIVLAGSGSHLHYGVNQLSVAGAIEPSAGWGFGRAPANATLSDAGMRGWLAPDEVMIGELLEQPGLQPTNAEWWSSGLVLEGVGKQNNGSTWTIRIEVHDDGNATINYDSIPCSGRLTVISIVGEKVTAAEEITKDKSNCITSGVVEVEKTGKDDFNYTWKKGNHLSVGSLKSVESGQGTVEAHETLREKLTFQMHAFGRTKLASGHLLETDLSLFEDGTGKINFFTSEGGITCFNDFRIFSETATRLDLEISPTERSIDACPIAGEVSLTWQPESAPLIELFYQNAYDAAAGDGILYYTDKDHPYNEAAYNYDRLGRDESQQIADDLAVSNKEYSTPGFNVSPNACENALWNGTVENVADLFLCDEARAISLFSSGRIPLRFEIQKVWIKDGWQYLETFTAGSFLDSELGAVQDGTIDDLGQFLNATSSYEQNWRIVCFLNPSPQRPYSVGGTFEGRGVMTQYEARTVVFDCR